MYTGVCWLTGGGGDGGGGGGSGGAAGGSGGGGGGWHAADHLITLATVEVVSDISYPIQVTLAKNRTNDRTQDIPIRTPCRHFKIP